MSSFRLTVDPDVIECLDTGSLIPRGHRDWPTEWLDSNTPLPIPPLYKPNTPAHYRAIRAAAWEWMTAEVVSRGYDGIESCASYYNSSIPRYQLEAHAMVSWRDAVNQALESLVMNPPPGISSWDQVRTLLPQPDSYDWPEKIDLPLSSRVSEGIQ